MFIIVQDSNNRKMIIRGGTKTNKMASALTDDLKVVIAEYKRENNHLFPKDYEEDNKNPRVTIASGTDAQMQVLFDKMQARADEINSQNYDYKLPTYKCPERLCHVQNSNTVVAEMVKSAGLELELPKVNNKPVLAPGINGEFKHTLADKTIHKVINKITPQQAPGLTADLSHKFDDAERKVIQDGLQKASEQYFKDFNEKFNNLPNDFSQQTPSLTSDISKKF